MFFFPLVFLFLVGSGEPLHFPRTLHFDHKAPNLGPIFLSELDQYVSIQAGSVNFQSFRRLPLRVTLPKDKGLWKTRGWGKDKDKSLRGESSSQYVLKVAAALNGSEICPALLLARARYGGAVHVVYDYSNFCEWLDGDGALSYPLSRHQSVQEFVLYVGLPPWEVVSSPFASLSISAVISAAEPDPYNGKACRGLSYALPPVKLLSFSSTQRSSQSLRKWAALQTSQQPQRQLKLSSLQSAGVFAYDLPSIPRDKSFWDPELLLSVQGSADVFLGTARASSVWSMMKLEPQRRTFVQSQRRLSGSNSTRMLSGRMRDMWDMERPYDGHLLGDKGDYVDEQDGAGRMIAREEEDGDVRPDGNGQYVEPVYSRDEENREVDRRGDVEGDLDGRRGDVDGSRGDVDGRRGDVDGSQGDVDGSRGDVDGSRGDVGGSLDYLVGLGPVLERLSELNPRRALEAPGQIILLVVLPRESPVFVSSSLYSGAAVRSFDSASVERPKWLKKAERPISEAAVEENGSLTERVRWVLFSLLSTVVLLGCMRGFLVVLSHASNRQLEGPQLVPSTDES